MSLTLALNQIAAMKIRFVLPAVGIWIAVVDLDLPSTQDLPAGKVTITVGTQTMVGTIDPDASGRFAEKAIVRVVGGNNGWSSPAGVQHFKNDAGLLSSAVISATAAAVGETVNEPNPILLGAVDLVRMIGTSGQEPASRVLKGRIWYVDAAGVTQVVDTRGTVAPSPDVDVLSWDPDQRIAYLSADTIVWPGTVLEDPRFEVTTIRDVEQVFDKNGSRVTAFCAVTEGTRATTALETMVEEFGRLSTLRSYEYRVSSQNIDGRLFLQATRGSSGIPDLLPIPVWPGIPGYKATWSPGAPVMVHYVEGDTKRPRIYACDGSNPLESHIDAQALVAVGESATIVQLGGPTAAPLAHSTEVIAALGVLSGLCTALGTLLATPPTSVVFAAFAPVAAPLFTAVAATLAPFIVTLPTVKVVGQ